MYALPEPDEWTFHKAGVAGKIFESAGLSDKGTFVVVETESGHTTTIVEEQCDFVYYILSGEGEFEIGSTREPCRTGDLVIVPHGTPFRYTGRLRMLLISLPGWYEEQERTL